jgi:hypothetical protein
VRALYSGADVPPECNEGGAGGGGNGGAGGGGNGGGGAGGSGEQQCEAGVQACGLPGQDPCPADYYCITGCCIFIDGPK